MPRAYHRRHDHCPPGYVGTGAIVAETGFSYNRVRRVARQHGLLIEVLGDMFVHEAGFRALLVPKVVPPLPAPTSDRAA
jgi:hypothetical protein